ncbi:hypothetical protein Tco_0377329, partial [Tanacetum coccineum]
MGIRLISFTFVRTYRGWSLLLVFEMRLGWGKIPCVNCVRVCLPLISAPNICVAAKRLAPGVVFSGTSVEGGVGTARILRFNSGEFSVKDTRLAIDDLVLPSHSEPTRWVKLIPIKINVFMEWRGSWGCLPTRYKSDSKKGGLHRCLSLVGDDRFSALAFFTEWDGTWFSSIRLPGLVK